MMITKKNYERLLKHNLNYLLEDLDNGTDVHVVEADFDHALMVAQDFGDDDSYHEIDHAYSAYVVNTDAGKAIRILRSHFPDAVKD